jgi:hypothetical protein
MTEVVPGIFDWKALHEHIGHDVHSTLVTETDPVLLIDPMEPDVEEAWFEQHGKPTDILLTNRLHDRGCTWFVERFECRVWCHEAGLHELEMQSLKARGFSHGQTLPGGVVALEVGVLCPEETAFLIPVGEGILAIGDAVIRSEETVDEPCGIGFVPDFLMGDDPEGVKKGMVKNLRGHLDRDFDSVVMAHGAPIATGGKAALGAFLDSCGY